MKYNSKGALVCSVASMLMLGSATISVAWLATQHKLMSSLDGAVSFEEMQGVASFVGHDLYLNVARFNDKLFQKERAIIKCRF